MGQDTSDLYSPIYTARKALVTWLHNSTNMSDTQRLQRGMHSDQQSLETVCTLYLQILALLCNLCSWLHTSNIIEGVFLNVTVLRKVVEVQTFPDFLQNSSTSSFVISFCDFTTQWKKSNQFKDPSFGKVIHIKVFRFIILINIILSLIQES